MSLKKRERSKEIFEEGRTDGWIKKNGRQKKKNGHRKHSTLSRGGLQFPINVSICTQKQPFLFRCRPLLETHLMHVTYFSPFTKPIFSSFQTSVHLKALSCEHTFISGSYIISSYISYIKIPAQVIGECDTKK
jgi:hypothetical protein